MKKSLFLLISIPLLICGCNKDNNILKCTKAKTDENGVKTTENYIIHTKDNMVKTVEHETIQDVGKDAQELTYQMSKTVLEDSLNKINGMNISVEKKGSDKIVVTTIMDYDALDVEALKELNGDDAKEIKTEITIEEFKKENLDGFTCK